MNKLITIIALCIATVAVAQNTTKGLTQEFFNHYEQNTDTAFDTLFATNPWMTSTSTQTLKQNLNQLIPQIGAYTGYEKLSEKTIGDSYKIITYAVKYERQPLRFVFKYYKAKDNWMIFNLLYDDLLENEL